MNPAAHGERSILVLGKAVVILDTLAESSPATLTLLTSTVGLNKSTVYRLLRTMVDLGLVEHLPSGGYRLGLRMLRYGEALRDGLELRRESLPYMAELANETGLATFLCIRRGDEAFCIERIAGKHVQLLVLQVGTSLPLHKGAASLVLLAHQPSDWVEEYLRRSTVLQPERLRLALAEVRNDGYAVSNQDVVPGIAALGAPVRDHSGEVVAAVSVSGVVQMFEHRWDEIGAAVCACAERCSHSLGYWAAPVRSALGGSAP